MIAHHQGDDQLWVLGEDGIVWHYHPDTGWNQSYDLPVAVSEVKFWTRQSLVTVDNYVWLWRGDTWENVGQWPGGTSTIERTSWGRLKAEFR